MSSAQLKKFAQVKPADLEWRNGLPFSREFNDIYFSLEDGLAESEYVFIEGNRLEHDWLTSSQDEHDNQFYIAELGFGSGLNFLICADKWQKKIVSDPVNCQKRLHYISIEKRPFSLDDFTRSSKLWPQLSEISGELIRHYPSTTYGRHQICFKQWNLTLTLLFMPVEDAFDELIKESDSQQQKINIDHWFLDGFAPAKNTSMWGESIANNIAQLSKPGTRLATFSVAGAVKKPLVNAGFEISKRKGFGRKREMLTASLIKTTLKQKQTTYINIKYESPWYNHSLSSKTDKVAIIGGGIAGCATAYNLYQKGLNIDLFESQSEIAQAASGAAAGIFHPLLTSDMNINSQFSWLSYLYLLRFLVDLTSKEREQIILSQGVDRLLQSTDLKKQLIQLSNTLNLTHWIKENDKSLANERNIFFPHAAALNMPGFCQLLLAKIPENKKNLIINSKVTELQFIDDQWVIKTDNQARHYRHVVFCGGARSNLLKQLVNWPTNTTRGQTCFIQAPTLTGKIKNTLCEQIYLVPQGNGSFHLGTTFEDFVDDNLNIKSQQDILNRASILTQELGLPFLSQERIESLQIKGTVGYRLHSPDRLPLIGGAVDQEKLNSDFSNLGQKRLPRKLVSHYNLPGLWLNTAYGSHGLLFSLLGSQHLASLIINDISPVNLQIAQALNPVRFLIKKL